MNTIFSEDGPVLGEGTVQQQTIMVPDDHNNLVVRLRDHTWVSLYKGEQEVASNRTSAPVFSFSVTPGGYVVRSDGSIQNVTTDYVQPPISPLELLLQRQAALLRLTSDAPDRHVVDGIGEIPADGTSYCKITIEKVAVDGTLLTGKEHEGELFLRTTGGALMEEAGQSRIRSLKLESGRATFRLVSEPSPKIVTVFVFGRNSFSARAEIQIEFV